MLMLNLMLCICCFGLSASQENVPWNNNTRRILPGILSACGQNEVHDCVFPCPPQKTCSNRDEVFYCTEEIHKCKMQCVCREGFVRKEKNGECIPVNKCDLPCGIHEVYTDCKPTCLIELCSSIKKPTTCASGLLEPCEMGCTCKEGYFRKDENSECMPFCLCPEMKDSPDCLSWKTISKK